MFRDPIQTLSPLALALLVVTVAPSCNECTRATDCPNTGEICYLGECQLAELASLACVANSDCGDELVCRAGRCRLPEIVRQVPDAGVDGGMTETPDSGTPDSGTSDSGTPDTGTPDSGVDSGVADAGPDAGVDAGPVDAGPDAGGGTGETFTVIVEATARDFSMSTTDVLDGNGTTTFHGVASNGDTLDVIFPGGGAQPGVHTCAVNPTVDIRATLGGTTYTARMGPTPLDCTVRIDVYGATTGLPTTGSFGGVLGDGNGATRALMSGVIDFIR